MTHCFQRLRSGENYSKASTMTQARQEKPGRPLLAPLAKEHQQPLLQRSQHPTSLSQHTQHSPSSLLSPPPPHTHHLENSGRSPSIPSSSVFQRMSKLSDYVRREAAAASSLYLGASLAAVGGSNRSSPALIGGGGVKGGAGDVAHRTSVGDHHTPAPVASSLYAHALPPLAARAKPHQNHQRLPHQRAHSSMDLPHRPSMYSHTNNTASGTPKQQRATTPMSVGAGSEMDDERAVRPYLRHEHPRYTMPTVEDDLWQPKKALRSLIAFDLSVDNKLAFEDFLRQGRSKATPGLVISYFKHFMCASSALVAQLKALPLSAIEAIVQTIPRVGTFGPMHFSKSVLDTLVGKHRYLEQDAYALFDFFDTDSDGEMDFRDLCNGFVLLRSVDGPVVPIVHRCMLLVAPKMRRESRLAMMTRLELLHLTDVLVGVLKDYVENARHQTSLLREAILKEVPPVSAKGVEMQQLRSQEHDVAVLEALEIDVGRDVRRMLETFSLDRRGNFPYTIVREYMLQSTPIQNAISLMRVPRDEDLYQSPLSEFFRMAEFDDASSTNREFRPLLRNKSSMLCGLQPSSKRNGLAMRRQTFSNVNSNESFAEEEESCVVEGREAVEHDDPTYYTIRGLLYRRDKDQPSDKMAASFVTKADYYIVDAKGKQLRRF